MKNIVLGILWALGHHLQGYSAGGRTSDQHYNLLQWCCWLHRPGSGCWGRGAGQLWDGDVPELHLCSRLPHAQTSDVSWRSSHHGTIIFQIKIFDQHYFLQVRKHRYVRPNAGFLRQLDELDSKLRRERGIIKALAWRSSSTPPLSSSSSSSLAPFSWSYIKESFRLPTQQFIF